MITNEEIIQKLQSHFADAVSNVTAPYGTLSFDFAADKNIALLEYLYNDADIKAQYLTDLTAVHYPDTKQIAVVYHLHSLVNNIRIRFKCYLPEENPEIESAVIVFLGANWMERETYDFYGVIFKNHPNLKRILNVDEMTVFPMRKEFPLEDPNRRDKDDAFFGR